MKLSLGLEVEVGYPQAMKASVCDLRGVAKDRVSFIFQGLGSEAPRPGVRGTSSMLGFLTHAI